MYSNKKGYVLSLIFGIMSSLLIVDFAIKRSFENLIGNILGAFIAYYYFGVLISLLITLKFVIADEKKMDNIFGRILGIICMCLFSLFLLGINN